MSEISLETTVATIADLDAVFKYAVQIVKQHQNFNPLRFSKFPDHEKLLYEYFMQAFTDSKSIIIVLKQQKTLVGYALVVMEAGSLVDLSTARAWLHDIFIDESARGLGGGKLLLEASKNAARELGSETLMLHVAEQNKFAQRLFAEHGFETTVFEMMCKI